MTKPTNQDRPMLYAARVDGMKKRHGVDWAVESAMTPGTFRFVQISELPSGRDRELVNVMLNQLDDAFGWGRVFLPLDSLVRIVREIEENGVKR